MPRAPFPKNEEARLCTLIECQVLDTEPEDVFDDMTTLAAELCDAPIALVSLVDAERQWFKSAFGVNAKETHRDAAFCAHAIHGREPFVVNDALTDPRTFDNILVLGPPHIRFYAGIPLIMSNGHALGTLCVIDTVSRDLTSRQLANLKALARQVASQLELRRVNLQITNSQSHSLALAQRLEGISAQVPGVVYQYELRPDGTSCFPYASEGIRQIYRVTPEEVESDSSAVFSILHPDDYDQIVESIQSSARDLSLWQLEYRVRFPNGDVRWLNGNATPTRLPDGIVQWNGFITDVTEQRLEKDRARLIQSQMDAVVQASTHASIVAIDLQGITTVWNAGAERLFGYSASEMIGRQSPQILHLESEIEANRQRLQKLYGTEIEGLDAFVAEIRHGGVSEGDWTFVCKDGSRICGHMVLTAIRDCAGNITGFVGVTTDVTAVRRAQELLKLKRERLEMALSGGELGTWDWNIQTGEQSWDERFCRLLGEDRCTDQIGVDGILERIHPDDIESVRSDLIGHVDGTTPFYETKFRLRQKNGDWRWVQARGRIMQYDELGFPHRMLGTLSDISARKKIEEELITARIQADMANQAKSQFLANMSHEIRTPLTSILGYAELLSVPGLSEERIARKVGTIKQAGKHLLTIINDVLDLSKIEAGRMTVERIAVSPGDLVREVVSVLAPGAKAKGLNFCARTFGAIPERISSDPVRIRQILMNLIGNAIKFTESGDVWLTMKYRAGTEGAAGRLIFEVSDTGIGMTEKQCENLFRPFMQADASMTRRFGGTGLGLTICRRMAQLLGGEIEVESQAGAGSTFRFYVSTETLDDVKLLSGITLSETSYTPSCEKPQSIQDARILLAEDNPVNRCLFESILKSAGAQVDAVENGQLAMEHAMLNLEENSSGCVYDLVIMDMQMPVLDGYSATKQLRAHGFRTPIIALTAHALTEDRQRCLDAGCDDFVSKPVERDVLIKIAGRWVARSERWMESASDPSKEFRSAQSDLNVDALMQAVGGDLAVLAKLTSLLQENSSNLLAELHEAIDAKDISRTQTIAHSLKGAVSAFPAQKPLATAAALESSVRSSDLCNAHAQLKSLSDEIVVLLKELKSLPAARKAAT